MKRGFTILTVTAVLLAALFTMTLAAPARATADGAAQISGTNYFDDTGACNDPHGEGDDFALITTGDLEGCLYTYIENVTCTPSGTRIETGRELFIGEYNGQPGTFRTTYRFEAKYQDCENLVGEIIGRCQHPLVTGSGTGIFEGVTGRFFMTDDVVAGNFPYTGHLR